MMHKDFKVFRFHQEFSCYGYVEQGPKMYVPEFWIDEYQSIQLGEPMADRRKAKRVLNRHIKARREGERRWATENFPF